VGAGGGVVEQGQRAVAVQQLGHGVGEHAGDVGAGRERPDPQRPVGVAPQLPLQVGEVEAAAVLGDGDHLGDRLPPGQLVGVVLEGADEHHRPRRRVGGQVQPQDAQQLVDGAGGARAGEDHRVLVAAADGVADELAGLLAQAGRLPAGPGALGVGVGVAGQDLLADDVLDERQRTAGGGVVAVDEPARPKGAGQLVVVADHRLPDAPQQPVDRGSLRGAGHLRPPLADPGNARARPRRRRLTRARAG
jgi:hypothetical protein